MTQKLILSNLQLFYLFLVLMTHSGVYIIESDREDRRDQCKVLVQVIHVLVIKP